MLLSFILPIILATTITTGDSYAKSTVVNEVEGGNLYTKIEVEANGEKKVLESSQSGTHTVEIQKEGSSQATVTTKIDSSTATTSTDSKVATSTGGIVSSILKNIFDFLKSIFARF